MHAIDTAGQPFTRSIAVVLETGDRPLRLRIGHSSRAAPGKSNEDCYGIVTPAEQAAEGGGDPQAIAEGLTQRAVRNQVRYMGCNDATAILAAVEQAAPAIQ